MLTVMRSTSLKTQKSPPTSPGRKKIVRFADTLGLDLAAVKTIMQEDLPHIPNSAFDHLDLPKELLSDIRAHISAAAAASSSPKPSPTSSPSSHHRIFNNVGSQASGAKPFLPKYPIPFHTMSETRNHYVNGLAGSLDRLHLHFEDDLLDDCVTVKVPTALPCDPVPPPSSILNKKPALLSQQETMAKNLPPWLTLYQSNNSATLIPEFVEPFVQMNFLDRVKNSNICLENCYISNNVSGVGAASAALAVASSALTSTTGAGSPTPENVISVTTCIRVVNKSFAKEIYCRFTTNDWGTWCEEKASFIPTSTDSWSDRFTATFYVAHLSPGQRVKFALRYVTEGKEYWDNNNGNNYSLIS